ncbi:MAG TPA: SIMPL domain-containing protein [Gaiellaceae bacterium]|nr:SIMPL domain-containing protein [Gaiellaceae bacterium]
MKKLIAIAAVAAAGVTAVALAGVGLPAAAHGDAGIPRTITVNGTGTVKVTPDRAGFSFGVDSRAATAQNASADNARAMQRLIDALKDAGVAADNIQTDQVSVWPSTDSDGQITGYTASGSVSVETSVKRAGAIVDVASGAGATNVSGPNLTVADTDAYEAEALHRALADAKRKAAAVADAAGASVGAVVKVVEGGSLEPPIAFDAMRAEAKTPVEPGTVDQTAALTVTFALQ